MCYNCALYMIAAALLGALFLTLLINTAVQQIWRPERDGSGPFLRYESLSEEWRLNSGFLMVTIAKYALAILLLAGSVYTIYQGVIIHRELNKKSRRKRK